MRVAILSNSHINMIKLAATEAPPAWAPTFFGAPATKMRGLVRLPRGRGLHTIDPNLKHWLSFTSGGKASIDYSDYDAFVVLGMGLRTHRALSLFCEFQPAALRMNRKARLISEAAFRVEVRERMRQSTAFHVMELLADQKRPVLVIPAPIPSQTLADRARYRWLKKGAVAASAVAWINEVTFTECQSLASAFNYRFASQPPEAIGRNGLALPEHSAAAFKLTGAGYAGTDVSHMNAAFGQIILQVIGRELGA
ncbi:hypothetical protein [Brevundimonas sp.]|uniref:hypothetical protein n=1 Tax=Brevundimonas sp. TaxID=1871086 RepID=UPI003BA9575A